MAAEDEVQPVRQGDVPPTLTRAEEELRASTVRRPVERVRVRKRIVTEMVTRTIPVRHEELVLERERILDDEPVVPREATLPELVLHREELVVETRVVPVERVRLVREIATDVIEVHDTIRRERIALEGDTNAGV